MPLATKQNTTAIPTLHTLAKTSYEREVVNLITTLFSVPGPAPTIPPAIKSCPFCLAEAQCDGHFHSRAVIYCDNDECPAAPQVTGDTFEDAAKRWNHRFHPGFVAPEGRQ